MPDGLSSDDTTSQADYRILDGKIVDASGEYWLKKVEEFRADNPRHAPGGIVLVGDSLTEGFSVGGTFPGRHVINRGISGDKIGGWKYLGVVDRLEDSVDALRPAQVYLLIGINDIVFWPTPQAEMESGYGLLLEALERRRAHCRITLQTLLPLRAPYETHRDRVEGFNHFLRGAARDRNFPIIDLWEQFRDADGRLRAECTNDGLHLTAEGYRRWAEILKPRIQGNVEGAS